MEDFSSSSDSSTQADPSTQASPDSQGAAETSSNPTSQPSAQPTKPSGLEALKQTAAAQSEPGLTPPGAPVIPATYQPNLKFKVMDQEREFDPFLKDAIKDADTEKKVRELYEKAYGLDAIKPKFQETREKYKDLSTKYERVNGVVQETLGKLQRGDLDGVFADLNLPKEKIYQYVLDKLNYDQLNPAQKAEIDKHRDAQTRAYHLEKQNQQLQAAYQSTAVQARTVELSSVLSRPELKSFADTFDAQAGQPGAFETEVIKYGKQIALERGIDLTAEQAARAVTEHYGRFIKVPATATPAVAAPQNPGSPAPAQAQKPVIPAVNGQPASPARKAIKSVAELRKLANSMNS